MYQRLGTWPDTVSFRSRNEGKVMPSLDVTVHTQRLQHDPHSSPTAKPSIDAKTTPNELGKMTLLKQLRPEFPLSFADTSGVFRRQVT